MQLYNLRTSQCEWICPKKHLTSRSLQTFSKYSQEKMQVTTVVQIRLINSDKRAEQIKQRNSRRRDDHASLLFKSRLRRRILLLLKVLLLNVRTTCTCVQVSSACAQDSESSTRSWRAEQGCDQRIRGKPLNELIQAKLWCCCSLGMLGNKREEVWWWSDLWTFTISR